MPTDPGVLGFSNRWYPHAVASAQRMQLPSGTGIRLIGAPAFIATKFEAFADRGQNDLLGSHDAEDIINLVDGRPELVAEVRASPEDLRRHLAERCAAWLAQPDFEDRLIGMIVPDESLADRLQTILQRLNQLARLA
jgi:predicted nucleotidyltransferase